MFAASALLHPGCHASCMEGKAGTSLLPAISPRKTCSPRLVYLCVRLVPHVQARNSYCSSTRLVQFLYAFNGWLSCLARVRCPLRGGTTAVSSMLLRLTNKINPTLALLWRGSSFLPSPLHWQFLRTVCAAPWTYAQNYYHFRYALATRLGLPSLPHCAAPRSALACRLARWRTLLSRPVPVFRAVLYLLRCAWTAWFDCLFAYERCMPQT
jgi:hypothetical protein